MSTEQKVTRKLRAILSADVKGYSILMVNDEALTVRTLKEYRNVLKIQIEQHNGRVVDSPGDNILADFASAVDAVSCAVEIQKVLMEKNGNLPEERRLEFRIGVNVGDVIQDGDRIYGHGVNVAARIEGLAEPNGVCISRNAYDHIRDKLDFGYQYLGDHIVKNIKRPIRVYKVLMEPEDAGKLIGAEPKWIEKKWYWIASSTIFVLLFVLVGLYWKYYYLPTPKDIDPENKLTFDLPKGPSIAVLPFNNMTGNPNQEYLCDGLTENIIYALSHVKGLFVVARNSSFSYKGKSVKVQRIGAELGVKYLIEGSIQNFNELLRVTVQLVDTNTGNHIWSEVYDERMVDFFNVQDEISIKICEAIQIEITEGETFRNRYTGIKDVKIAKKVLKATEYLRYHQSPETLTLGFREVEDIVELGFESQTTYLLIGFYNLYAIEIGVCENTILCFGKATEATRKALSFDENNSDAHVLSAYLFLIKKEHEKAINSAKRAILLNPNNGDAYSILGIIFTYAGQPKDGIRFLKKAIQIDPIPPMLYLHQLGVGYLESKQYTKAIETFKYIISQEPKFRGAYIRLAGTYSLLGDQDEARKAASEVLRVDPNFNLSGFVSKLPYKKKADNERYVNALRKAGLPD